MCLDVRFGSFCSVSSCIAFVLRSSVSVDDCRKIFRFRATRRLPTVDIGSWQLSRVRKKATVLESIRRILLSCHMDQEIWLGTNDIDDVGDNVHRAGNDDQHKNENLSNGGDKGDCRRTTTTTATTVTTAAFATKWRTTMKLTALCDCFHYFEHFSS